MVKEENTRAQVKSKSVVVWMGPVGSFSGSWIRSETIPLLLRRYRGN